MLGVYYMNEKKSRLIEIVGNDEVFEDPEFENSLSLDHTLLNPSKPGFQVRPKNVEEVQKIVLWANETRNPLVPISSSGPHFRGDTTPTTPEAVMVDLSRMNRILKIDRRNRLALIEPGVTFAELQPALQNEGVAWLPHCYLAKTNRSSPASGEGTGDVSKISMELA
jgi:FAD/FMN-containing dehydrogenase